MATLFRASALTLVVLSVTSCALLKEKILGDKADAAAEAGVEADAGSAPAPVTPAAAPAASNEDDVARFPDEARLENVAATLQRLGQVREVPLVGARVATLPKGTAVTQVSQRDKYFLVSFQSPTAPGTVLMGWLHQDAFSAPGTVTDAGVAKPLTCAAPMIAVFTDAPICAKLCEKDADCGAGQACHGSGQRLKDGKAGDAVTICSTVVPHDAGAPTPPKPDAGAVKPADAGAPAPAPVVDAGAKPAPAAVADAGAKPAAATVTTDLDVVAAVGGKCAAGFMLVKKDNKCHRLCPTFGECKQKDTRSCVACDGNKVCSASRDLCK